jgi:hypothetical protein
VVRASLIGCAFLLLLVVGCAGGGSETSNKKEQGSSPQATASEEARCEGTRTFHVYMVFCSNCLAVVRTGSEEDMKKADKKAGKTIEELEVYTTNDLPGCPNKGGLLSGTDKEDALAGKKGGDKIRGLGGNDEFLGGDGNDVLDGGAGNDVLSAGQGEDVMYGGDGNDLLGEKGSDYDGQRDKLYCGEGRDEYNAFKKDYVDSSCEKEDPGG